MAFSKADHYEAEEQKVGNYCGAFNHPARQRILKQLKREGILTVLEIRKEHPLAESTMSQHLSILRECGLVSCDEATPYTYYQINLEKVANARRAINAFFDVLECQAV